MNIAYKVNYKYVLLTVSAVLVLYGLTVEGRSAFRRRGSFHFPLTVHDTIPPKPKGKQPSTLPVVKTDTIAPVKKDSVNIADSASVKDTLLQKTDTVNFRISKDSLDAPVEFLAEDSMVVDIPGDKVYIYNKGEVNFKDITLKANVIQLNQQTKILTAYPTKDSAGNRQGVPSFKQGEEAFVADTIRYNFETQKGQTVGTYTQQQEMFVYVEKSKRITANSFYGAGARFTSCNFDTPHFAFRAAKTKFISNKVAVTGAVRPEFEGVPIPIGLPFGLFPLKQGRRTGILPPQPVVNQQLGFGLEGLGYYKTFGEYWDASIRTNIYSYGSWNLFLSPSYRKRYRYNGGFNMSFMNNKVGFKGDPDYVPPTRNFSLQWSHSVDGKARPGTTFSANVNVATSLFNQFFPNNAVQNFNNQLNSSIAYQRTWAGKPYNLTVTANHNQNTNQRLYNITLPAVGFTVNTIYPFQKKEMVGAPKWYEKLGIAYNGTFNNQISFYDTSVSVQRLLDTLDWNAAHSIPIQLSLPPMGPLQIGPAISYNEIWHSRGYQRVWNGKNVETITRRGLFRDKRMSLGLNFSTALFGTKNFKRKTGVQAIRHVVRPTFGIGYTPNLNVNNWRRVQVDSLGNQLWFDEFVAFSGVEFFQQSGGNISFGIDNNLELKTRSKKDTSEEGIKKIRLIDGFGFNGSYNISVDSFNLSDFNFYLRSNLFDKINITAGANISPYKQDASGRRLKEYVWQNANGFSIGKFTSGFVSVNTQFKSKPKDDKKEKERKEQEKNRSYESDERAREMGMIQGNPQEFADFNVPWSLNLSYALNLTRVPRFDFTGFTTLLTQSLNFNGDFNLTEKWKIQGQGTFDIQTRKLQFFTASVARDLHCWQLAINVTPIGPIRTFSITINPKSSLLRDLRINRSRFFYNNIPR